MSTTRPLRRRALLAFALPVLVAPGCVTCAMWDSLDHNRGQKVTAALLTPVTVAVDAVLIAGYVCAGSCGCDCRYSCR